MNEEYRRWLEKLIAHETAFFAPEGGSPTPAALFLHSDLLPGYHDCNRALRLRDYGKGPEASARAVVEYFLGRERDVVADVDPIAEEQGIGAALRRMGAMPVTPNFPLLRYEARQPPAVSSDIPIQEVGRSSEMLAEWLALQVCEEQNGSTEQAFWREVAVREALVPGIRLFLALHEGVPAGGCCLFIQGGWARIESVITHPLYRRKGIACALVAHAVRESLAAESECLYLFTEKGGNAERIYRKIGFAEVSPMPVRRHLLPYQR